MRHARQAGFTLIELSIVLVVIGLIAGGVLVGSELIHASQIRSVISDLEKYNTAVNTFKIKYNCLPGDCVNATMFFGQYNNCNSSGTLNGTTCNGNGDAMIGVGVYDESFLFWQQLGLAGLIPGVYSGHQPYNGLLVTNVTPTGKLHNITYTVYYNTHPNGFPWVTWTNNTYSLSIGSDIYGSTLGFSPDELYAIDSKMDDGMPGTGIVQLDGGPSFALEPKCATSNNMQTALYNIAVYSGQWVCNNLWIRAPF